MNIDKKDLIRDAAIKIIAREGFYNTRISQIAHEAGVAVGTVYNYFKSKDDILEYIFAVELEKRLDFLKEYDRQQGNNLENLEDFLKSHFREIRNNPDLGKILVREKDFQKSKGPDYIREYLQKVPELLQNIVEDYITSSGTDGYNPELTASLIFGAIQGVAERAITEDRLELLEQAPEEIIRMLKARFEV